MNALPSWKLRADLAHSSSNGRQLFIGKMKPAEIDGL
jgi:hypothetical protein